MKIVIDTNIICQDYWLEKPHFRVLLEGCSIIPATIYIPEVVVDELVNRYKEDLEEAVLKFQNAIRNINILTKEELKYEINDIDSLVNKYKTFLSSKLKERGVNIIPYPEIPHKKIVERDLARKKPFKRDGSGYRDYLIWENVKHISLFGEHQVAFITNNIKDFGEGPYIDDDLAQEILNKHRLKIFRSLKQFNDEYILPKLKKLEEIKRLLQEEKLEQFDIRKWLEDNLLDLLRNYDLEEILAGFPEGVGSAWISDIVEIKDIKIEEVSELENENKLVTAYIEFEANCNIDSDWDDYVNHEEVREFWGENEAPFSFVSISLNEVIRMTVDLVVDGKTNRVDSEEIIRIEADYGEIEFGRW